MKIILLTSDVESLTGWLGFKDKLYVPTRNVLLNFGHLFQVTEDECSYKNSPELNESFLMLEEKEYLSLNFLVDCIISPSFNKHYSSDSAESLEYYRMLKVCVFNYLKQRVLSFVYSGINANTSMPKAPKTIEACRLSSNAE